MEVSEIKALDLTQPFLEDNLIVKHLAGHLQAANLFSRPEFEDINCQKDNTSQVKLLVSHLKRAGSKAFDKFLGVLEHDGVKKGFVAEKLRKARDKQRQMPQDWHSEEQISQREMLHEALRATRDLTKLGKLAEARYEKLERKHDDFIQQMDSYSRQMEKRQETLGKQLRSKVREIDQLKENVASLDKSKDKVKEFQKKIKALKEQLARADEEKMQMAEEVRRGKDFEDKVEELKKQIKSLEIKDKVSEDRFQLLATEFERTKKERDQALGTNQVLTGFAAGLTREETLYKYGATQRDAR